MKVLYITSNDLSRIRGSTIHILEIVRNLEILGHEVYLYAYKKPPSEYPICRKIFSIPLPNVRYIRGLWFYFASFVYLLFIAYRYHPNLIYFRMSVKFILPAIVSKLIKIPLVVEVNGYVQGELTLQSASGVYTKYAFLVERTIYSLASKIVTVTEGLKTALIRTYSISTEKITVIPNGVNTELYRPLDANVAKDKIGLSIMRKYIIFVGYISAWQGLDTLLESVRIIISHCPEARLLVIGVGPELENLKSLAKELDLEQHITFHGEVPQEMAVVYINAADICVLTSSRFLNEQIGRSPIKLFTYLACGKPVVATDIKGISEFLIESNAGILVEPEDPTELAEAIIKLLEDDILRCKLGENARQSVIKNHGWGSIAKNVEEVLLSIVE